MWILKGDMPSPARKSDPNPFQLEAIKALRAAGWKVAALAAAFEVSERTIERAAQAMKQQKPEHSTADE